MYDLFRCHRKKNLEYAAHEVKARGMILWYSRGCSVHEPKVYKLVHQSVIYFWVQILFVLATSRCDVSLLSTLFLKLLTKSNLPYIFYSTASEQNFAKRVRKIATLNAREAWWAAYERTLACFLQSAAVWTDARVFQDGLILIQPDCIPLIWTRT